MNKSKKMFAATVQRIVLKSTKKAVNKCWFPSIHETKPSEEIVKWAKSK